MSAEAPLQVVPLGGCGEFGLNLTCYLSDGHLLVVDCGLMFPTTEMLGVDLVLPDFQYLREQRDRVAGIVITHGHEDHIGALPFLLREVSAPVYATPFTLGLIRERLDENDPAKRVALHPLAPRERVSIGPFTVEPIRVAHSIPDTVSLAIECSAGLVIHTGDFKLQGAGLPAAGGDLERFTELGQQDVLLLTADSTNAMDHGLCPSESDVAEALKEIFATAPGRIFIAQFASNIERLNTILGLCRRYGRSLALEGRSIQQYARLAEEMGLLQLLPGVRVSTESALSLPPRRMAVVITGTQAEPGSVLKRLALGEHPSLRLDPGDTVVLSGRVIPGRERQVNAMIDECCRQGATVVSPATHPSVHASGHGFREDLQRMILMTRPSCFLPVHGRYQMLAEHAEIARHAGLDRVHVPQNGEILAVDASGVQVADRAPSGTLFVDGKGVGDVEALVLRDRRALAHTGIVVALITIDEQGALTQPPELTARGVLGGDEEEEILARAAAALQEAVETLGPKTRQLPEEVADVARRHLRRFFRRELARKPVVIPLVIER